MKIPILGMGGITEAQDALEFMIAGASAVQVSTANFVDPFIWPKLLDGIYDYMRRHQIFSRIADLVGTLDTQRASRNEAAHSAGAHAVLPPARVSPL